MATKNRTKDVPYHHQGRIQALEMGGGGKIFSEARYINKRRELRAKRVKFSTPESESERNLTHYFIFVVTFSLRTFWKIFFGDYRSNPFQIFEDNNETINNICKSNTQKVNN